MRILVLDDDAHLRTALRRCLALEGHEALACETGAAALQLLQRDRPDAAIVDWGLPDIDGVEVCRRIRAGGDDLPILMLTARDEVGDRVAGLDAGADDYLTKPFDIDELLARLRALLRRSSRAGAAASPGDAEAIAPLRVGDLTLDVGRHRAVRGERELSLTRTEFALLELLMRHADRVLERGQIMQHVWDYDFGGSNANLDVYVSYLRRKLEAEGEPRMLHTIRGVGYTIRPTEGQA